MTPSAPSIPARLVLVLVGLGPRGAGLLERLASNATIEDLTTFVGTPDQVAEALLADVDLGVDIISALGYDSPQDAIDCGDQVIPLVRAEVGRRDAVEA